MAAEGDGGRAMGRGAMEQADEKNVDSWFSCNPEAAGVAKSN